MVARQIIISLALAVCLSSLATAKEVSTLHSVTGAGWSIAQPTDAGFDADALEVLVQLIESGTSFPNIHALLIEHRGRLVFERYWPGEDGELGFVEHGPETLHDIRSMSKSVTSLLLGIALDRSAEYLLTRSISSFFPKRDNLNSKLTAITLHQVLSMTAGLAWNETFVPYNDGNDFVRLLSDDDPVGFVLAKEIHDAPGDVWSYNSGLTELTAGVIENLTAKPLIDYAEEMLFDPLNITDYEWWRPPAWSPGNFPSASAGLRLRARDMAKIGSLILHDGNWQGHQAVPKSWIDASTMAHVETPIARNDYGYFWFSGTLISGPHMIRASGWGDQHMYVLPELGLVITIFAGNYEDGGGPVGERIVGRIVRAFSSQ